MTCVTSKRSAKPRDHTARPQPKRRARHERPERWLDLHGDALYRFAYLRTRDESLAEDLVQETLLVAFAARELPGELLRWFEAVGATLDLPPFARVLDYAFPVHRLSPDNVPTAAPAARTYLVVYRDRGDAVRFMEINPLMALLLQQLRTQVCTGGEALARIARDNKLDADAVRAGGAATLDAHSADHEWCREGQSRLRDCVASTRAVAYAYSELTRIYL